VARSSGGGARRGAEEVAAVGRWRGGRGCRVPGVAASAGKKGAGGEERAARRRPSSEEEEERAGGGGRACDVQRGGERRFLCLSRAARRERADSRKGGRGTANDASTFCLTFILFRSRAI
jgi:hypothetical protein